MQICGENIERNNKEKFWYFWQKKNKPELNNAKNGKFASNIKTDLISSYGYIILEAYYEETDYLLEVNRLSEISYDLKNYYLGKEEHKVQKIKYDDDMYN